MLAEFVVSATSPQQFPKENLPEIAFLGRSNVGKSSLINALLGQKRLAFTSSRPGCTQTINFYRVDNSWSFVDLPGYGYAQVPVEETRAWKKLIENYLENRQTLQLSLLVLDARRGWMEKDLLLKDWLEAQGRDYQVVITKTDKLKNQSERHACRTQAEAQGGDPILVSAQTGRGVREIWQAISKTRRQL